MVIWQFKNPRELALVLNLISAMFGLGGMLAPQVGQLDYVICLYLVRVQTYSGCRSGCMGSMTYRHAA